MGFLRIAGAALGGALGGAIGVAIVGPDGAKLFAIVGLILGYVIVHDLLVKSETKKSKPITIDSSSIESLLASSSDRNWRVREASIIALGEKGDSRAIEPLINMLGGKNSWAVPGALAKIGKAAIVPLLAALNDDNRYVREGAAAALGGIEESRVLEPLINSLRDEDSAVRQTAATALGRIKDSRAVKPLITMLNNSNYLEQMCAASALGEIKDVRAIEPLIVLLKDKKKLVRERAQWALEKITGKYFGNDFISWWNWWEQNKEEFLKGR